MGSMDEQPVAAATTLGQRLRVARRATGLSSRAVAAWIRPTASVSHVTVMNYERDVTRPTIDVLAALAGLYGRPLHWFVGGGAILKEIRYRNLAASVGVKERFRVEGHCLRWLGAYAAIETYTGDALTADLDFKARDDEAPASAAARFRSETYGLGENDIFRSVVDSLERCGCRVMELETELAIDVLSGVFGEERVVVLTGSVSRGVSRITIAHELAHVVLGHGGDVSLEQERAAFEFASHLLVTSAMLCEAFRRTSVVDLVRYAHRFGVPMSLLMYRAQAENLIRGEEAQRLWSGVAKRRYLGEGRASAERATRFESIVDGAVMGGRATLAKLAEVGEVREDELRRRIDLATESIALEAGAADALRDSDGLRLVR